ncbi:DEAD/DEAH box helicase [Patescibacteria group bacterium]|nr:DEAD/DEAH box helicase [Patescibacteria group bacterium]
MQKERHEFVVAAIIPQFLERGVLWFKENKEKVKAAVKTQPFWKQNILVLEKDRVIKPSELLRIIGDFGYERARIIFGKGEFAQRGNIIDIWPINEEKLFRIEFFGNKIENIIALEKDAALPERKNFKRHQTSKEFSAGNYVVHLDHGIGIFKEIRDNYFVVEYAPPRIGAESDLLKVPLEQKKRLSPYVGFETPTIHRLGGTTWLTVKKKAKESAEKLAQELVALYAKRECAERMPYAEDDMEKEFAGLFEYAETPDQLRALKEIFHDLERPRPMDRILCGDVGFGKTEIAMRAAFRAVLNNKQVALIAPTAILAEEHLRTFQNRFAHFPVKIASLSRLTKPREAKSMLGKLKNGEIDIVIGTHRLLSRDVAFKNIGLIVVDEEQRFGVKQKEKFKSMRSEIDILSLSATPIPRTLHLALARLRDISVIETPPEGRVAVKNFVLPYSAKTIRRAIENELARNGQIYFLHNRVETIALAREKLIRLLKHIPHAHIEIIHGRMPEQEMMRSLEKFRNRECNILLATTIIENGLDFSNANTLIVDNAARLGLAQAYQIRGRIGRGNEQAYAYFFYRSQHLTESALQRLTALQEFEELGSGYGIALRDLEIRGSGNVLGREQSGAINKVGLNLYSQILADAVEQFGHR